MALAKEKFRISGIEIFQLEEQQGSRYLMMKLSCSGRTGWGQCVLCQGTRSFDLVRWCSFLFNFRKMPLLEAWTSVEQYRDKWGDQKTELIRSALMDLFSHLCEPQRSNSRDDTPLPQQFMLERCQAYLEIL